MGADPVNMIDPDGGFSILGAVGGSLIGAGIGGLLAVAHGDNFWDGAALGAPIGFAAGAAFGPHITYSGQKPGYSNWFGDSYTNVSWGTPGFTNGPGGMLAGSISRNAGADNFQLGLIQGRGYGASFVDMSGGGGEDDPRMSQPKRPATPSVFNAAGRHTVATESFIELFIAGIKLAIEINFGGGGSNDPYTVGGSGPAPGFLRGGAGAGSKLWSATSRLSSTRNAFNHWKKHAAEFPEYFNATQYVRGARNFLHNSPKGTLVKLRPNGDVLKYHPSSNTFGVMDAAGNPRTMFRPVDGMKYWLAQ